MKILTALQIRQADQYTIQHEPVSSLDLMERAALSCVEWLTVNYTADRQLCLFCGTGNNGGDGLVIARHLVRYFKSVSVYIVRHSLQTSPDFQVNREKLPGSVEVREISQVSHFPVDLPGEVIVVDAIFGSGLNRPVSGLAAAVIEGINQSGREIVAIDLPSGLFGEDNSIFEAPGANGAVVRATHTLTFEFPKLALLYDSNYRYAGEWHLMQVGLHPDFVQNAETPYFLLTAGEVKQWIKKRQKTDHKGTFGHALLVAGSYGKIGAAVLSLRACLRSGVGLLTAFVPRCGYEVVQTSVPEAMTMTDVEMNHITRIPATPDRYSAIGIGPGLGTEKATQQAFRELLGQVKKPMVIDADALNILSENKEWLSLLPAGSILTPHPKEFERLSGSRATGYLRHRVQVEMAQRYGICIVLKGAHTCIALPDGTSYFNSAGNPGMATGGSGDVLTGMLTSLLAQGYDPATAAKLGVFLHGYAGDLAAALKSQQAMIAGDIVDGLGAAFLSI